MGQKILYTVVERDNGKSYWTKIGTGVLNRDGSMALKLDCIPLSGTVHARDAEPPAEKL